MSLNIWVRIHGILTLTRKRIRVIYLMSIIPYRIPDMGLNAKAWALNWLKGSFISYLRGATSERIVLGRVRRCLESYGISIKEVKKLAISIAVDPSLNLGPSKERQEKLDRLLKRLEQEVTHSRIGGK